MKGIREVYTTEQLYEQLRPRLSVSDGWLSQQHPGLLRAADAMVEALQKKESYGGGVAQRAVHLAAHLKSTDPMLADWLERQATTAGVPGGPGGQARGGNGDVANKAKKAGEGGKSDAANSDTDPLAGEKGASPEKSAASASTALEYLTTTFAHLREQRTLVMGDKKDRLLKEVAGLRQLRTGNINVLRGANSSETTMAQMLAALKAADADEHGGAAEPMEVDAAAAAAAGGSGAKREGGSGAAAGKGALDNLTCIVWEDWRVPERLDALLRSGDTACVYVEVHCRDGPEDTRLAMRLSTFVSLALCNQRLIAELYQDMFITPQRAAAARPQRKRQRTAAEETVQTLDESPDSLDFVDFVEALHRRMPLRCGWMYANAIMPSAVEWDRVFGRKAGRLSGLYDGGPELDALGRACLAFHHTRHESPVLDVHMLASHLRQQQQQLDGEVPSAGASPPPEASQQLQQQGNSSWPLHAVQLATASATSSLAVPAAAAAGAAAAAASVEPAHPHDGGHLRAPVTSTSTSTTSGGGGAGHSAAPLPADIDGPGAVSAPVAAVGSGRTDSGASGHGCGGCSSAGAAGDGAVSGSAAECDIATRGSAATRSLILQRPGENGRGLDLGHLSCCCIPAAPLSDDFLGELIRQTTAGQAAAEVAAAAAAAAALRASKCAAAAAVSGAKCQGTCAVEAAVAAAAAAAATAAAAAVYVSLVEEEEAEELFEAVNEELMAVEEAAEEAERELPEVKLESEGGGGAAAAATAAPAGGAAGRGALHLKGAFSHRMQLLPGVFFPYYIGSQAFTNTAWHVEDFLLQSINLMLVGRPKAWWWVPRDKEMVFREYLEDQWDTEDIYTKSVPLASVPLEKLVKMGIRRSVQLPGAIFITSPGYAFHTTLSSGWSMADSANFMSNVMGKDMHVLEDERPLEQYPEAEGRTSTGEWVRFTMRRIEELRAHNNPVYTPRPLQRPRLEAAARRAAAAAAAAEVKTEKKEEEKEEEDPLVTVPASAGKSKSKVEDSPQQRQRRQEERSRESGPSRPSPVTETRGGAAAERQQRQQQQQLLPEQPAGDDGQGDAAGAGGLLPQGAGRPGVGVEMQVVAQPQQQPQQEQQGQEARHQGQDQGQGQEARRQEGERGLALLKAEAEAAEGEAEATGVVAMEVQWRVEVV